MSSYHSLSWLRKLRSLSSWSDSCWAVRKTTMPSTTGNSVLHVGHSSELPDSTSGAPWSRGQQRRSRNTCSIASKLTQAGQHLFEKGSGGLVRRPCPVGPAGQAVAGLVLVEADGPRPVGLGDVAVQRH